MNFLQKIFGPIRKGVFSDEFLLSLALEDGRLVHDLVEEIKSRTDLSKSERHKRINTLMEWIRLREHQRASAIGSDLDCSEEFWGWSTK